MSFAGDTPTLGVSEQCKILESLLEKLLHKDAISAPQLAEKSEIKEHLEKLQRYFKACSINSEETKIGVLLNTLTEEVRLELCGILEFEENNNDYNWIEQKLIHLFHPKQSEIAPLVKLYSCKQRSDQPIRDFLSEIRVEGYKLLKHQEARKREECMVDAFIKGLYNKEMRLALSQRRVNTLDEAYRLVKKEKNTNDAECIRTMEMKTDQANEIEKLKNQMLMIQKQLSYIVTILEKTKQPNGPSYADVTRRKGHGMNDERGPNFRNVQRKNFQQQQSNIQCWNCGLFGHVSRMCRLRKCASCGQVGHVAQNCRSSRKPRRIRRMWEDEGNEDWETDNTDDQFSDVPSQEKEPRHINEIPEVCAITIHESDMKMTKEVACLKTEKKQRKDKQYPEYINDLEEYIEGRRSKKHVRLPKEETLIAKDHAERARNKPLVSGKCESKRTKIFLDTGAEISVIDEGFIQQLEERSIRRHRQNKIIKCANNSRMETKGWVKLRVQIGKRVQQCKFWVVQNLFPRVILGIRAMRDMDIAVDPARQCVWVHGDKVPLLARVQSQSLYESCSGNAFEPGLRVGGRQ